MNWRPTLMVAFLMLGADPQAWACACGGVWPSVKQAWQEAPFVFLGTVEFADPDEESNQMMFREQAVRIRVDEPFKGVSKGQTIRLHQGASDCDAKSGLVSVLFSISTEERQVGAGACHLAHMRWATPNRRETICCS